MVRTWTSQVARAAGASLLAPLVLLLVAGAVASGGGMGGFGSLGEISSGPSLPDTGLTATPGEALADAQIVGADLTPPPDVGAPAASASGAIASATPPGAGPAASGRTAKPGGQELSGQTLGPQVPSNPGSGPVPPPTIPAEPPASAPGSAQGLEEVTRGLGDAMRAPLEPLTNAILELLRGPPRR